SAKERLARLKAEAQAQAEEESQEQELRLVIGHLQEFAERVRTGLADADWSTRREIIRALVKRVEVNQEEVRVVYQVRPSAFVESPEGGILQDCGRGAFTRPGESNPGWTARAPDRTLRRDAEPAQEVQGPPGSLCG